MKITDLHVGDVFVEHSEFEWSLMSTSEKKKAKRVTLEHAIGACRTAYDRIHLKTSAGDWCISVEAPVTLIHSKPMSQPTGKVA